MGRRDGTRSQVSQLLLSFFTGKPFFSLFEFTTLLIQTNIFRQRSKIGAGNVVQKTFTLLIDFITHTEIVSCHQSRSLLACIQVNFGSQV